MAKTNVVPFPKRALAQAGQVDPKPSLLMQLDGAEVQMKVITADRTSITWWLDEEQLAEFVEDASELLEDLRARREERRDGR